MKKTVLSTALKAAVTALFLLFLVRMTDRASLAGALRGASVPLIAAAFALTLALTAVLAVRWFFLLRPHMGSDRPGFGFFWRVTLVGLFFNIFLPTGSGGDLARILYLVKDSDRKLALGSSVFVDRLIGALTVMAMGLAAGLATPSIDPRIRWALGGILGAVCLFLLVFLWQPGAAVRARLRSVLPPALRESAANTHRALALYVRHHPAFLSAVAASFLAQVVSILSIRLMAAALFPRNACPAGPGLFFLYIPLIWASSLVPSVGGLGVREFSYVFFFAPHLGREKAVALSLLVLASILLQSCAGALVFLFARPAPGKPRSAGSNAG